MRTRNTTKTQGAVYRVRQREFNAAGAPVGWIVRHSELNYGYNILTGTITDDFGPKSSDKRQASFRPCTHVQSWVSTNASLSPDELYTVDYPVGASTLRVQTEGFMSYKLSSWLQGGAASALSYPAGFPVDFDNFASQAKAAMYPSLSDGSSIANFIYELRDFKRLGTTMLGLLHARSFAARRILMGQVVWDAWGIIPWDSRPKNISRAYLAWRFAWAPLIADINRLVGKLLAYQRKIREFIRRQKQTQQRYYGKTIRASFTGGSYGVGEYSPPLSSSNAVLRANADLAYCGVHTRKQEVGEPTCRMTATMRYSYTLPGSISSMEWHIHAFLDVLGINANPAVIWNAIPFSFVVDWFSNVSGFLAQLRVDNIRATTTVTKFCVSARFERNYLVGLLPYMMRYSSRPPSYFEEKGVQVRSKRYERRVFEPSKIGVWLGTGGGLTGDRAGLAAALAHANSPQTRKTFARGLYPSLYGGETPTTFLEKRWRDEVK